MAEGRDQSPVNPVRQVRPPAAMDVSTGRSTRVRPPRKGPGPPPTSWPGPTPPEPEPPRATRRAASARLPRGVRKVLVPGENITVAQRRHAIVMAEPVLTSVAVLLGIFVVSSSLGDLNVVRGALITGWAVLVGRAVIRAWRWRVDWLVVTDRRLMRVQGILDRRFAMMPLAKVTDMSFEKPIVGRLLGWGTFVLESAGQDQALREIRFVVEPDDTYRTICTVLFGREVPQKPRS